MFSTNVIRGKNLREAWEKTLRHVLNNGVITLDTERKELLGLPIIVENPLQIDQLPEEIRKEVDELKKDYGDEATIDDFIEGKSRAGRRVREQIDEAIKVLKNANTAQRAVIPVMDRNEDRIPKLLDPTYSLPACIAIEFKYKKDLHIFAYLRTCDVVVWLPLNILQLSKVLGYAAEKSGYGTGCVELFCSRAFIKNEFERKVREILKL